eukprot:m.75550 g.75550  ORF g.75550 m.75550 type:complete len:1008 (-) comp12507_c0_seq1:1237-4260(-)
MNDPFGPPGQEGEITPKQGNNSPIIKRRRENDDNSCNKPKRLFLEEEEVEEKEIHTNTAPQITEGLGGNPQKALFNLVSNAYDAAIAVTKGSNDPKARNNDPNVRIEFVYWKDGEPNTVNLVDQDVKDQICGADKFCVKIVNPCSENVQLQPVHFVYCTQQDKLNCNQMAGKCGYGLKEAIAMLKYFNLQYKATTPTNVFTLKETLGRDGSVLLNSCQNASNTNEVTQEITLHGENEFNGIDLFDAISKACVDNWWYLVQNGYLDVLDGNPNMGHWSETGREFAKEANIEASLFVHGKRRSISQAKPYFLYNLPMKTAGDNQRPPHNWYYDAFKIFKKVPKRKSENEDWTTRLISEFLQKNWWESEYQNIINIVHEWQRSRQQEEEMQSVKNDNKIIEKEFQLKHLDQIIIDLNQKLDPIVGNSQDDDEEESEIKRRIKNLQAEQKTLQKDLNDLQTAPRPRPLVVVKRGDKLPDLKEAIPVFQKDGQQGNLLSLEEHQAGLTPEGKEIKDSLSLLCRFIPATVKIVKGNQPPFWDRSMAVLCVPAPSGNGEVHTRCEEAIDVLKRECPQFNNAHTKMLYAHKNTRAPARQNSHPAPPTVSKQFRPLLLIDEWGTSTGGIAAFNYQLACELAETEDTAVYVCLPEDHWPSEKDLSDHPNITFVRLKSNSPCMLGQEAGITTLIAHGNITGDLLKSIAATDSFKHCSKWLFLHTTPQTVDPIKGKEANAENKHLKLEALATDMDEVFCVGDFMYNYWQPSLQTKVNLRTYHPALNKAFMPQSQDIRRNSTFTMSLVGRIEGEHTSKGSALISMLSKHMHAVRKATSGPIWYITLRGIKGKHDQQCCDKATKATNADFTEARKQLGIASNPFVTLKPYGTHDDVRRDLAVADVFLMPSVVEPFGLVGLEALAAGVLPVVPAGSGLALHFEKYIKSSALKSYLKNIIVDHGEENGAREEAWASALEKIYRDREDTNPREMAAELRAELLENQPTSCKELYKCHAQYQSTQ